MERKDKIKENNKDKIEEEIELRKENLIRKQENNLFRKKQLQKKDLEKFQECKIEIKKIVKNDHHV